MQADRQHVYQVSELTYEVRQLLEASYPDIWVEGEVSNLARPASGHLYFSLKDEKAQIRCAFFRNRMSRLDCKPEDGMKLRIKAQVGLYENRGDFQLIVTHIEETGLGDLQAAFEKLKQKLAAEGLFANEHKKPLPRFPQTIGVITSASGAAVKDIISTCERRYPIAKILLYPVQVQGETAAKEIASVLSRADKEKLCDVLIVGRGGGSLEDLWAFNEEILARAIFACQTPIISAVGHDIDFTIADFVADVRAPTPTAAGELATPDTEQLLIQFEQAEKRLLALIKNVLINRIQHTDMLLRRLIHPSEKLKSWQRLNNQLFERLKTNIQSNLNRYNQYLTYLSRSVKSHSPDSTLLQITEKVDMLNQQIAKLGHATVKNQHEQLKTVTDKLITLSPQSTLERGYAIVTETDSNQILRRLADVKSKQSINVQLADGSFKARTED